MLSFFLTEEGKEEEKNKRKIIRRAAFDIGSGSTKIQCSDYEYYNNNKERKEEEEEVERERRSGKLLDIIFSEERPIAFGTDYLNSKDGNLSEEIQLKGLETLKELKEKAETYNTIQFTAIATEVFRKAKNGLNYLERVKLLGIEVVLISQDLEAELGYQTALIDSKCNEDSICVWDSGGSSFQIITKISNNNNNNNNNMSNNNSYLEKYMASIGSSTCASMLAKIKNISKDDKNTPNPVTYEESQLLIEEITNNLPTYVPECFYNQSNIYAICGKNSIFKVCCNVLEVLAKGTEYLALTPPGLYRNNTSSNLLINSISNFIDPPTHFTLQECELAISTCLNCTDDLLCKYVNFQYSDGPKIIVPKLCLLYSVMKYLNVQQVTIIKCIGSCSAVICDERFWLHTLSSSSLPPPPSPSPLTSSFTSFTEEI